MRKLCAEKQILVSGHTGAALGVVSDMRETTEAGLFLPIQTYSDCLPHAISDFAKALAAAPALWPNLPHGFAPRSSHRTAKQSVYDLPGRVKVKDGECITDKGRDFLAGTIAYAIQY